MKKYLFIGLLVVLVFIGSILALQARAQAPGYDVTLSPVFFDLSVVPGGNVSDRIRIRNNTNFPIRINIEVKKLTGDEAGELTLKDDSGDNSLSWVKFQDKTITASPLEWTNIPFKIEVPSSAAYGYYYAVSFTDADTKKSGTTGADIKGAAAVPILLNVRKEGAKAEAKLLDFSVGSYINEYLPVDFNIKLENTGNVHMRPRGNIFISDGRNDNISILDVNQYLSNVIPSTKKDFPVSWTDGFIVREPKVVDGQAVLDKSGKPETKLRFYWNKLTDFRIGKYTANLLMVYDNGQRDIPIEASKTFWVIPYKVIIGFIVFVILAFFVLRFLIKRYIQREVKRRLRQR